MQLGQNFCPDPMVFDPVTQLDPVVECFETKTVVA